MAKVEAAAEEARREHLIRVAEGPVPERLVRTLRRLRSDVAFVGRATAGNDFDWQGLGLLLDEVATAFRASLATPFTERDGPSPFILLISLEVDWTSAGTRAMSCGRER